LRRDRYPNSYANKPKVILPCTGDRVFGMAQDNEMAFAFPWSCAHEIIEGLEGTHKGGTRYPITVACATR